MYSVADQASFSLFSPITAHLDLVTWPALGHRGQEGVRGRLEASSSLRE